MQYGQGYAILFNMTFSEELAWRGFVNQTTLPDPTQLDTQKIKFYWGVDPSAPSMTIGNLAAAMMVRKFIKAGHEAVLLVGGATGLIGDPDGKAQERTLKTIDEIAANKKGLVEQYKQIFGDLSFEVVDNYDWFKDMNYLTFLRDIGKHVPMRQMLGRDFVQTRLQEGGAGISYAEFSYSLIQGYDFLHLFTEMGVTMQVAASDQWGNSIAGVELIRRITGKEAHIWTTPLIVNKATGIKFGKSEEGAVWLDPHLTSPNDFYQFWVNVDDDGVGGYLKIFTELDQEKIGQIMAEFEENKAERLAQKTLAYEVTKLVHGENAANQARAAAGSLTDQATENIQAFDSAGSSIVENLVATGLASSKTEARQLLASGGVYINDQQVTRDEFEDTDFVDGQLRLRRGKTLSNTRVIRKK